MLTITIQCDIIVQIVPKGGDKVKRRRQELSVLNVLFCLMVIMIHILSYPVTTFIPGTMKYTVFMLPWRLGSFVVQGFIFLAGVKLFLTGKDEMKYVPYLKMRSRAILAPYIFCCIIYCIAYTGVYHFYVTLEYFLTGLVCGSLAVHFYFVPLLVQFDLLFPLWKKLIKRVTPIIVIPVAFVASAYFETNMINIVQSFTDAELPLFNDRILTTYLSFWIAGCYVGRYYDKFCRFLRRFFPLVCVVFAAMFAFCGYASYIAFNQIRPLPEINTIHYVYSFCAILFLMALALRLPENITGKIPLFRFVDSQSYNIYLWHLLVLVISDLLVRDLGLAMQSLAFIFRVLFVYPATFLGVKALQMLKDRFLPKKEQSVFIPPKKMNFKVKYTKKTGLG